jgi:predicted transcriptional regulator
MTSRLTIRVSDDLMGWLKTISRKSRLPVSRLIRGWLEEAKTREEAEAEQAGRLFLRHAGSFWIFTGGSNLS